MPIYCYLTADAQALDTTTHELVFVKKDQKIQVVTVRENKTTFYIGGKYYIIDSDKLRCR